MVRVFSGETYPFDIPGLCEDCRGLSLLDVRRGRLLCLRCVARRERLTPRGGGPDLRHRHRRRKVYRVRSRWGPPPFEYVGDGCGTEDAVRHLEEGQGA